MTIRHSLYKPLRRLDSATQAPGRYVLAGLFLSGLAWAGLWLAGLASFYHWNLGTGLLFVTLWCLHPRWWPWLLVAAMVTQPHGAPVAAFFEPLVVAAGAWLLKAWGVLPGQPPTLARVGSVHLAALVVAVATTFIELALLVAGHAGDGQTAGLNLSGVPFGGPGEASALGNVGIRHLLCEFIGVLLPVPLAMWVTAPAQEPRGHAVLARAVLVMVPVTGLALWLSLAFPGSEFAELIRLFTIAAIAVFTLWQGWRGGVLAVLMLSALVALEQGLGQPRLSPIVMQGYVAVVGAMVLLFGASVDDFRRQAADLARARRQEHLLLDELQDAALRNLQLEESERRRLARELHDEFGQNLAALQTHLKLAAPHLASAGRLGMADLLLETTRNMQRNISRVLADLRPAGLEQLGLFGAVDRGSVRRLAQDAGLDLDVRLEGDARLLAQLDATHATAVYRMAQEAVTNIVRHAGARRARLKLRISRRRSALWVFLDIRDDGIGRLDRILAGNGLTGMRDRVLALNGALHLHQLSPGLRLHLLVRQDDDAPLTGR